MDVNAAMALGAAWPVVGTSVGTDTTGGGSAPAGFAAFLAGAAGEVATESAMGARGPDTFTSGADAAPKPAAAAALSVQAFAAALAAIPAGSQAQGIDSTDSAADGAATLDSVSTAPVPVPAVTGVVEATKPVLPAADESTQRDVEAVLVPAAGPTLLQPALLITTPALSLAAPQALGVRLDTPHAVQSAEPTAKISPASDIAPAPTGERAPALAAVAAALPEAADSLPSARPATAPAIITRLDAAQILHGIDALAAPAAVAATVPQMMTGQGIGDVRAMPATAASDAALPVPPTGQANVTARAAAKPEPTQAKFAITVPSSVIAAPAPTLANGATYPQTSAPPAETVPGTQPSQTMAPTAPVAATAPVQTIAVQAAPMVGPAVSATLPRVPSATPQPQQTVIPPQPQGLQTALVATSAHGVASEAPVTPVRSAVQAAPVGDFTITVNDAQAPVLLSLRPQGAQPAPVLTGAAPATPVTTAVQAAPVGDFTITVNDAQAPSPLTLRPQGVHSAPVVTGGAPATPVRSVVQAAPVGDFTITVNDAQAPAPRTLRPQGVQPAPVVTGAAPATPVKSAVPAAPVGDFTITVNDSLPQTQNQFPNAATKAPAAVPASVPVAVPVSAVAQRPVPAADATARATLVVPDLEMLAPMAVMTTDEHAAFEGALKVAVPGGAANVGAGKAAVQTPASDNSLPPQAVAFKGMAPKEQTPATADFPVALPGVETVSDGPELQSPTVVDTQIRTDGEARHNAPQRTASVDAQLVTPKATSPDAPVTPIAKAAVATQVADADLVPEPVVTVRPTSTAPASNIAEPRALPVPALSSQPTEAPSTAAAAPAETSTKSANDAGAAQAAAQPRVAGAPAQPSVIPLTQPDLPAIAPGDVQGTAASVEPVQFAGRGAHSAPSPIHATASQPWTGWSEPSPDTGSSAQGQAAAASAPVTDVVATAVESKAKSSLPRAEASAETARAPNASHNDSAIASTVDTATSAAPTASSETPRAEAPRLPPQTLPALASAMARQMAAGNRTFTIRLDPAELGRIEVRFSTTPDKEARAVVQVERAEALVELQRSARDLEMALSEAGYDLAEGGLTFTLGQSGDGERQSGRKADPIMRPESARETPAKQQDVAAQTPIKVSTDTFDRWRRARVALSA